MKILTKRVSSVGEPQPRQMARRPWPRKQVVRRPRIQVRTLIKANPADALSLKDITTTSRNTAGTQVVAAGTLLPGTNVRTRFVRKVVKMTPKTAKGTRVVKPPRPMSGGKAISPYGKNKI